MTPASAMLREAAAALGPEYGRLSCDLLYTANQLETTSEKLRDAAGPPCRDFFAQDMMEQARRLGSLTGHAIFAADVMAAERVVA